MNIDTTKTLAAYELVADKMEYLTKQVHEYVLLSGFLESNSKVILKALEVIAEGNDELLVASMVGKVRHKLPQLRMGIKLSVFDKERARLIAASLITQVLLDNHPELVDNRVEPVMVGGQKKFRTSVYVMFGGSFEKDLLKGIEDSPGVVNQKSVDGWKLKAVEKAFLRRVSSIPFVLSTVCSKELLKKGYSLKVDWGKTVDNNGRRMPEDPIMRNRRYNIYADTIVDKVGVKKAFYLPMKYCGVKRMYYECATLEGMRPHGKLWETLMIDAAVPFDLTEDDERVLKHIIYVTLHGRVSVDEANELFSLDDMITARTVNPLDQVEEAGFGEAILLNKASKALIDYVDGVPSKFMFGYDFTNSGLLMSGVSFRSEKMMAAANIAGQDEVVDSHTAFGDAYDLELERKDVKSIHMGLMHGSALQSIATTISETVGSKVTVEQVKAYNAKAYGSPVDNIPKIAEWGTKVIGNEQTVLRWTMRDGFSACSRAYLKGVPVMVYSASGSHKEGYTSHVIVSDMPWVEDINGFPMYSKETVVGGITYKVEQKRRGLFARITHGIDAYMLRNIGNAVMDTGRPMLFKHDDFITPPSGYEVVKAAAKEVFEELFETNFYQDAVDEIIKESPYDIPAMELVMGDAECTVEQSDNFLMP